MLNYELAKQLKDAGFPHSHTENCYFEISKEGICKEITLSELIEACGGVDITIKKHADHYPDKKFTAVAKGIPSEPVATPEEAVAKLWLELNKSKS